MKGGNVNDFIDHTTFEECAVIYKGEEYFFHGLIFDKEKMSTPTQLTLGIKMATLRELYSTKQQSLRKSVWNLLKTSQFLMESLFGKPSLKWNGWSGRLIVVKPNSL